MTDRAAELREALIYLERWKADEGPPFRYIQKVADAARTIALPILERDEGLMERVAIRLLSFNLRERDRAGWIWEGSGPVYREGYLVQARAVLAAIIPEEGEDL